MSNGIYLTLEQYKDKDLPITITINGHTYHSQFALATAQTTWFEMGKQHGMELGGDKTYSDKEMSRMHDQWYNEGYADGYKQGKQAGITNKELPGEWVLYVEQAYKEGYNDAKGEDDYCKDCKEEPGRNEDDGEPIEPEQTEYAKGYDEGKKAGYVEGYAEGLRLILKK